ncbi:curli assembly protein CsgF [Qipengyuania flava]|uniref:curli assembly protein CsgF n=1 Tax=Qipengyuania flava TaxID=192812 RepID=UPI001E615AE2|nr:curli assembly protein CsgF [Qipengyuania flava]
MGRSFSIGVVAITAAAYAVPVQAQDLVHEPISPTFGGNPFNSNHILGTANAQNKEKDPNSSTSSSQADIFARQLQSRLLSSLSSQIVDAIFGENPQESGVVSFGGQTIEFFRSLDSVTLIITNDDTGEETRIVVPLFVEVN